MSAKTSRQPLLEFIQILDITDAWMPLDKFGEIVQQHLGLVEDQKEYVSAGRSVRSRSSLIFRCKV